MRHKLRSMRRYQRQLMDFHWSLSDTESRQVFRTVLNILDGLNNTIVWMVSICPLISKSSSPLTKSLGILLPIIINTSLSKMLGNCK